MIELLLVVAIIAIVAAIAIPGLMRARVAANEGSAIASVRAISSAQATFSSSCGGGGYAESLADLARPPMGDVAFVSPDLASGFKGGYMFGVEGGGATIAAAADTCNGSTGDTYSAFVAMGNPIRDGETGVRAFGVNESGVLRNTLSPAGITDEASFAAAALLE